MRSRDLGSSARNIPRLLRAEWDARGLGSAPPGTKAGSARAPSRRPERGVWTRVRKGIRRAARGVGQTGAAHLRISQSGWELCGLVRRCVTVCPRQRFRRDSDLPAVTTAPSGAVLASLGELRFS